MSCVCRTLHALLRDDRWACLQNCVPQLFELRALVTRGVVLVVCNRKRRHSRLLFSFIRWAEKNTCRPASHSPIILSASSSGAITADRVVRTRCSLFLLTQTQQTHDRFHLASQSWECSSKISSSNLFVGAPIASPLLVLPDVADNTLEV